MVLEKHRDGSPVNYWWQKMSQLPDSKGPRDERKYRTPILCGLRTWRLKQTHNTTGYAVDFTTAGPAQNVWLEPNQDAMKTSQEGKPDQDQHLPGQQQPPPPIRIWPWIWTWSYLRLHSVWLTLKLTENFSLACQGLSKTSHFRDIRVEVLVEACPENWKMSEQCP